MEFIAAVDVTPATTGAWTDVDCSAHIPAGASGIIFHYRNVAVSNLELGWRKNGSTDSRTTAFEIDIFAGGHGWAAVGVDGSRIAEFWVENDTDITIWLIGYLTSDDATFLTNATDYSLGVFAAYTDIDITADSAGTATGAIFDVSGNTASSVLGFRKNGSTDDIKDQQASHGQIWAPLDANEICEVYAGDTGVNCYLMGYIKSGVTWDADKVDVSLGSTGAWTDLTSLPSGAKGAIYDVKTAGTGNTYGFRYNGDTEDVVAKGLSKRGFAIVQASSDVIEGQISSTSVDFYRVGYFTASSSTIPVIMNQLKSQGIA